MRADKLTSVIYALYALQLVFLNYNIIYANNYVQTDIWKLLFINSE
jgi:hypothetical protein